MKKISLVLTLALFLASCGCSHNSPQQLYVKNVAISKNGSSYKLTVVYYDFSRRQEEYSVSEYADEDIYKVGIKAVSDKNYNFRLCEKVFLYPEIFLWDIDKAVYIINGLKISPNTDIICYAGQTGSEKDIEFENIESPLYNISVKPGGVSGRFPVIDGSGGKSGTVIALSGAPVLITDNSTDAVVSMLTNSAGTVRYTFRDGQMWAALEGISARFYTKDKVLNVELDMSLKDYKGIRNSIQSKEVFIKLLKSDITNNVYVIYKNLRLSEYYNLHWYCKLSGEECDDIKVKVNIM